VRLYRDGGLLDEATTAADGGYEFAGLAPGDYTLVETDPAGYVSSTGNNWNLTLVAGETLTINFGDYLTDTPTPTATIMPTAMPPIGAWLPLVLK